MKEDSLSAYVQNQKTSKDIQIWDSLKYKHSEK